MQYRTRINNNHYYIHIYIYIYIHIERERELDREREREREMCVCMYLCISISLSLSLSLCLYTYIVIQTRPVLLALERVLARGLRAVLREGEEAGLANKLMFLFLNQRLFSNRNSDSFCSGGGQGILQRL